MIVVIVYQREEEKDGGGTQRKVYMECGRINYVEEKDKWGFSLLHNDEEIFSLEQDARCPWPKVYVMENGKTVDTLPRR